MFSFCSVSKAYNSSPAYPGRCSKLQNDNSLVILGSLEHAKLYKASRTAFKLYRVP